MPASASLIYKRRATGDQYSRSFLQVQKDRIQTSLPVQLQRALLSYCSFAGRIRAGEHGQRTMSRCGDICVPVRKGVSEVPFPFLKALLIPLPHPDPQPSHSLHCNSSGPGTMNGRFFSTDHSSIYITAFLGTRSVCVSVWPTCKETFEQLVAF